jgi:hypothetical protein
MTDPIQIESPQANINRARFASKDFFTFVDDLVARIQVKFVTEFNDFVAAGLGQMLIDMVSWAAETLSFYIDRQASESYLATARTRKAVNRLARQLGYKLAPAVSAATDLDVLLREIQPIDIPVPEGFQFLCPNGLIFESVEAVTFPAGEGPASPPRSIGVREGSTRVENFTSGGSKNQIFRLNPGSGKFIAAGTMFVQVDGAPWTESEIITFDQTDQYESSENADPPTVRFGNGVAGNIPPSGADIRVQYLATSGRNGLVTSETIDNVVSQLVVSFTVRELIVINPDPSSGGENPESLESAKANAPRFFKPRDVAVTREDYENLGEVFVDPLAGAVSVAQAFVARGADDDLQLQILLDNIRAISEPLSANVQAETATARSALQDAETNVTDVTTSLAVVDAELDKIVTNPLTTISSGEVVTIRDAARALRIISNDVDQAADDGKSDGTLAGKDGFFDDIKTAIAGVEAEVNTTLTSVGNIETSVDVANGASTDIGASLVTLSADLTSALTDLDDIDALVVAQFETAIETELDAIFDHVDAFLSADCKANLIEVPILTRDIDGFLQEPPIALQRSLQAFLDARKEVTQVPEVVSGGPFLVFADITATIGVTEGFVQATVLSNVTKAIDDLLRVRKFGMSLRLSDVYRVVVPDKNGLGGVDGVSYATVTITGPVDLVDADGDLVITQDKVVTKGTVSLTAEVAAA